MQDGMDACGVYQFDREAFMIFLFQDLISPRKEGRWGRWRVYDIRHAISLCTLLRSDELRLNGLKLSKLGRLTNELECSSTIKLTIPSMS
jgi:hypothetical protein